MTGLLLFGVSMFWVSDSMYSILFDILIKILEGFSTFDPKMTYLALDAQGIF